MAVDWLNRTPSDASYIYWLNNKSSDYGLVITSAPEFHIPNRSYESVSSNYKNGSTVLEKMLPSYTITVTMAYIQRGMYLSSRDYTEVEIQYRLSKFFYEADTYNDTAGNNWAKTVSNQLLFSKDIHQMTSTLEITCGSFDYEGYYYTAHLSSTIDIKALYYGKEISVTWEVQPLRHQCLLRTLSDKICWRPYDETVTLDAGDTAVTEFYADGQLGMERQPEIDLNVNVSSYSWISSNDYVCLSLYLTMNPNATTGLHSQISAHQNGKPVCMRRFFLLKLSPINSILQQITTAGYTLNEVRICVNTETDEFKLYVQSTLSSTVKIQSFDISECLTNMSTLGLSSSSYYEKIFTPDPYANNWKELNYQYNNFAIPMKGRLSANAYKDNLAVRIVKNSVFQTVTDVGKIRIYPNQTRL